MLPRLLRVIQEIGVFSKRRRPEVGGGGVGEKERTKKQK